MQQYLNKNFRSMDCENCQCNVCLGGCMACYECYRAEFAEEDWEDFYYPYDKDDRSHCFRG